MLTYVIYAGVAALIIWAACYLIYRFHQQLKGKRGCRLRRVPLLPPHPLPASEARSPLRAGG